MAPFTKKNSKLFEKIPNTHEVGISVQNLHKPFGNFHVVNGINLELYTGQITVHLGYNGTEKTITISIIFKRLTQKQAKSVCLHLPEHLNILQKYNTLVNNLSRGNEEKMSFAIALIGNSKVYVARKILLLPYLFRDIYSVEFTNYFPNETSELFEMLLKIKVLLWKSFHLRKKHWFSTIIEILVPCMLFFIFSIINSTFYKTLAAGISVPKPINEEILHRNFINNYASGILIYTPKTLETEKIMNIVTKNLNISSSNTETANSEDEIIEKFSKKFSYGTDDISNKYIFGIVFEETIKSTVFKYKIRNAYYNWHTDKLFPLQSEKNLGPMDNGNIYITQGFLSLQLTLDKAFISLSLSDTNILNINDYNFNIQSYPYTIHGKHTKIRSNERMLPWFTILGFLFMCSNTIKRVSEEKESGVKELMKMMGLKYWMLSMGWIFHNLFLYSITISIITYLSCFAHGKLLYYTSSFLFWIFLVMYMIAGTFFCFAISSLFKKTIIAIIFGITVWILSCQLLDLHIFLKSYVHIDIKIFLMLFPNFALIDGYTSIFKLEYQEKGLQLSTLFTTGNTNVNYSVGIVLFMFIIQCFLYGFIAWYFDSVMPGVYGIAKPFNFLCKWPNKTTENNVTDSVSTENRSLFEIPLNEYEVGISVKNLHKVFGDMHALNGVNLNLYKGQITVLLGHNGAGKTTTMSIITGLFSPSYGTVQFNGNDIFINIDRFRDNLGLCPQHNLLFPYLTTLDHLIFFGMLKGMKLEQAKIEGLDLLKLLNILRKKNSLMNELSGGMKRKLSLAIALIGSPEILILDEPTSGLDPESRRKMWNLILSFRGTRTILITTHFMEEADALGDQIAIMDHGQVICYGTSSFLKKALGTGYNLTIIKEESCSDSKILTTIKQILPKVEIRTSEAAQIIFNLHNENINKFSDLFKLLESNRKALCIKGMGLSCTTMEDVFLNIPKNEKYDVDNVPNVEPQLSDNPKPLILKTSRINLLKNQFKVLFGKKALYTYRKWPKTFIFGVIPIFLGTLTILKTNNYLNTIGSKFNGLEMSLSIYKDSSVYYRAGDSSFENLEPTFVSISKAHKSTVNEVSFKNNITNDLLNMCEQDVFKYRKNLMIAGDFYKTNVTVIYNNIAIHTPAIAVNLYTNALLKKLSGNNESYISTINEPINLISVESCVSTFAGINILWMVCFIPSFLFLIGYFIALPLNERLSGFKHLQMMTKLSPIMYWSTCFIWDYICYIIFVLFTLMIMYVFDEYHIVTDHNVLYVLLTLLLIYGWSSIIHVYAYTFLTKTLPSSMILFLSINLILGMFFHLITFWNMRYYMLIINRSIGQFTAWNIFRYISLLVPQFSYILCMNGFLKLTFINKICEICINSYLKADTCRDFKPKSYFVFRSNENEFGILEETLFLFSSSLLYIIIILLFDYKIFSRLYQSVFNKIFGSNIIYDDYNEDPDVGGERDKVNKAKNRSDDTLSPILIVDDLVKKYSFNFTAVRGISFTVSPGECFGLLGIGGAGKTTTFRMLTGDLTPSKGDASIHLDKVYKLSSNTSQYVSMIGYCPQYNALNGQLTSKETLKLIATLRGISPSNTVYHVNKWVKLLGLDEYKNRICEHYSGGNKRKLSTAIALIGDPPVVFLDEPTSGVDPVARRNLWQVMAASQREGQAVILTSHSMDECEALCNRLTVMVDGQMKCIGSIQYLKNLYGQGFTVMVNLRFVDFNSLAEIKSQMELQFAPDINLYDEHMRLLHYQITNPKKPLSEIFATMNEIKKSYAVIEDYTISDTSLEQVFIAFAKRRAVRHT